MKKMIVVYPSFLAGMGPAKWLWGVLKIVKSFSEVFDMSFEYIGPNLFPKLISPIEEVKKVSTVEENYVQIRNLLSQAVKGVEKVSIISIGYTSYTSWAIKEVIKKNQKAKVMIVDSSPPDTDEKSVELKEGIPTSRFHWPSYESSEQVKQALYLFSTYEYDHSVVKDRIPKGIDTVFVGKHPYPVSFETELKKFYVPQCSEITIPIICSGDYWDKNAIGNWMTADQFYSMEKGTLNLLKSLGLVAEQLEKEIIVPIDSKGFQFIKSKGWEIPLGINFKPFENLPENDHWALMKSASVSIIRGGNQTNAAAAATLLQAPFLFWNVPGFKYMQTWKTNYPAIQSEMMSGFDWNANHAYIVKRIIEAINAEGSWKDKSGHLLGAYQQNPSFKDTLMFLVH